MQWSVRSLTGDDAAEVGSFRGWGAFARNEAALDFYARHGFEVAERTAGSANEEREPDVRMRWSPERVSR